MRVRGSLEGLVSVGGLHCSSQNRRWGGGGGGGEGGG